MEASQNPAAPTSAMDRMRMQAAQNPNAAHQIALQCRIIRYDERIGIKIDRARYREYRSSEQRPMVIVVPPVILEQEALFEPDATKRRYAAIYNDDFDVDTSEESIDQDVPSWQRSAPKAALYVNKDNLSAVDSQDKEPYPKKFEEIIAFLQTGKEIPGIVKIPDTVIDDPSISTTTGRSAPLKPWEKKSADYEGPQ
ncbi:hypothetical protein TruAng_000516 [Truncatella angustata]|nr:hypothetical protein TruAng_000516 [Truncatella angustata]